MEEAGRRGESGTAMAEAEILGCFIARDGSAKGEADLAGHVAYALHREALVAFRAEFTARQGRPPEGPEEAAFLVGETSAARIATYRAQAAAMLAAHPARTEAPSAAAASRTALAGEEEPGEKTRRPRRFRLFPALGMFAAPIDQPAGPINWKGLLLRFLLLLLAVIATALLLRILVVHAP